MNPVIRKNKKWYNTITKRFVSESYAKRLNNYFLKNPEKSLIQARGHAIYEKEKELSEHSMEMKQMLYSKGTQVFKTKSRKGKTIYYSPVNQEIILENYARKLQKLDYKKGEINVELYRITRDKKNMYHILNQDIYQRLTTASMVEFWVPRAWNIFNGLLNESFKIHKKHNLGGIALIYFHVSNYFYSDMDGWEKGVAYGFVTPNNEGKRKLKNHFKTILNFYRDKLEIDSYHNIMVQKITFYIYAWSSGVKDFQKDLSKFRVGVTHIPYKKSENKAELKRKKLMKLKDFRKE